MSSITHAQEARTSSAQLNNEGESSPVVSYSIVEGGLSGASVDAGFILTDAPLFENAEGLDGERGSLDDDLRIQSESPAVDAGDNSALPMDRADLDGDREATDPFPVDQLGNIRRYDGGSGSDVVDLGAFEYGASSLPVSTGEAEALPDAFMLSDAYPNPFSDETTIRFGVREAQHLTLRLYDAIGRLQRVLYDGTPTPGRLRSLRLRAAGLPSGHYFVRMTGKRMDSVKEITLIR